ncbi:Polyketide synthase, enoylreductase [Penicillium occitanis (nom. inval.)]|nr:Polyketide synthase, enoylreductase [Penicillium occitanis (nom. inval.)]PCG93534.1 hypothetical protein PENOC_087250 [Penicillium occitanis (nom. inval.)]
MPKPGPREIVIKNVVVAINPVDWKIQDHGRYLSTYPFILGEDAAGVVEEVGSEVTRFKKGQRVIAHCPGLMTRNPANSAFQLYSLAIEDLTAELADSVSFQEGAVLPLALSTASAGLFQNDTLGLPLPSPEGSQPRDETILVWGGASSVGSVAIQLAVASGLSVVTTASPRNHDFVRSCGAHTILDYKSPTVVEDIIGVLRTAKFVGVFDSIAEPESFEAIAKLVNTLGANIKISSVLPYDKPTETFAPKYVVAFSIIQEPNRNVGEGIWKNFVPQALKNGKLMPKPEPYGVGRGLQDIQHALDVQKSGVSAKKVIIEL